MIRLVNFKLNPNGKWATLSGVLLGIAFFVQAADHLLLHELREVSIWRLLVMMALPMLLEGAWCMSLRAFRIDRAEVYGILGAAFCLILLLQSFFWHGIFQIVLFIILLLAAGAAMVLITWGFFAHRALGALIFLLLSALRVLLVLLHRLGAAHDWLGLLTDLPSICMLLAMTVFFAGIRKEEIA